MQQPQFSYQGPRWFISRVQSGREGKVQFALLTSGYRAWFPRVRKWITSGGSKQPVYRPAFVGYVFVEVDYPRQCFPRRERQDRSGFLEVINNCGIPAAVPDGYIAGLMKRELEGEFDQINELPIGARVAVMEGEFRYMLATIVSKKHGIVTIKPIGSNKHVRASLGLLRPAEPCLVS